MALIKCIECGHEVSDKATICPNCGCPVGKEHSTVVEKITEISGDKINTSKVTTKVLWCILALVLYLIIGYIFESLMLLREFNKRRAVEAITTSIVLYASLSFLLSSCAAKSYSRILTSFGIHFGIFLLCILMWKTASGITIVANILWIICCFFLIWESGTLFYTKNREQFWVKGALIGTWLFAFILSAISINNEAAKKFYGVRNPQYLIYNDDLVNRAENGDAIAQFELFWCYRYGNIGPAEDYGKALHWLLESASNGFAHAMYCLGLEYESEDVELAKKWLKKAADLGHEEAKDRLKWIEKEGG